MNTDSLLPETGLYFTQRHFVPRFQRVKLQNRTAQSMKTFKPLIVLAALLTATACEKADLPGDEPPQNAAITFNPAFAEEGGHTRVSTAADFGSTWDEGDVIGLFAVSHTGGSSSPPLAASNNYINNGSLKRSGGSWTSSTPYYFSGGGNVLDFYAYCPRQADVSQATGMSFTVQADQSTPANYNRSDLLWAKATNQTALTAGGTVNLAFAHVLSLVEVEVTNAAPGTVVILCNVKPQAEFNPGTVTATSGVTATGSAVADIRMLRVAGTNRFRALVPPQTIAAGSRLFDVNVSWVSADLTSSLELMQGGVKKYSLTLP
jgi:hypothetical protein